MGESLCFLQLTVCCCGWQAQADAGVALTERMVTEAVSILRGAVTIVYPAGLPEYDPVRAELENRPQLSTRQPDQLVRVTPRPAGARLRGVEALTEVDGART